MKKFAVTVGIVMLASVALIFSACSLFEAPEGQQGERIIFDEFGRRTVEVTINTGDEAPRNMSLEMAQAAINYYEVVFNQNNIAAPNNSNTYIRVGGPRGKVLVVRLPDGQPLNGAGNAVVFGGYWDKDADQRTLLAVGNATHRNWEMTDGVAVGPTITVDADTYNIRFQLSAVQTRFDTQADSSFQMSPGTGGGPVEFIERRINNRRTPIWKIPANTTNSAFTATSPQYDCTFTYDVGGHNAGIYALTPSVIGTGTPPILSGPGFASWAVLTDNPDDGLVIVRALLTGTWPTPGQSLPANIGFTIYPGFRPQQNGFVLIFPNFTVYPIHADAANFNAEAWGLRNGIMFYLPHDNDGLYDENGDLISLALRGDNPGASSTGGGLLLQIGESSGGGGRAIRIIIDGPPPVAP